MRNYCRYASIVVVLGLILAMGGCGQKPDAEPSVADQPGQLEPAPIQEEEPTLQANAEAFTGTDFITGDAVEFDPQKSDRPAIISFFSPG